MRFDRGRILSVLDDTWRAFTFPMLDNGYVYLAATGMSLFRSDLDWALVIDVFGYSPCAFQESPPCSARMHWDHEPAAVHA